MEWYLDRDQIGWDGMEWNGTTWNDVEFVWDVVEGIIKRDVIDNGTGWDGIGGIGMGKANSYTVGYVS